MSSLSLHCHSSINAMLLETLILKIPLSHLTERLPYIKFMEPLTSVKGKKTNYLFVSSAMTNANTLCFWVVHPSHLSGTLWWKVFRFGTNINLNSSMKLIDLGVRGQGHCDINARLWLRCRLICVQCTSGHQPDHQEGAADHGPGHRRWTAGLWNHHSAKTWLPGEQAETWQPHHQLYTRYTRPIFVCSGVG